MSLVEALTAAILPVLSVAVVGFVLGTVRDIDVEPLSTVTIYVLAPALVFYSLATSGFGAGTVARLIVGITAFTVGMLAVGELYGRATGRTEPTLGALVLTSAFPNAGNYGIPLAAFAFGAVGRSTAVLYIAVQSVLMYTVGVYVASRGAAGSVRDAFGAVFKLPLVYAVIAAGVARTLDIVPPERTAAMETIRLTGDAAIPVMLLLLGIQLANTTYGTAFRRVVPAVGLKLLVAPIVAVVVALGIGIDGDVGRVFVLACAMPSAVTPLILTIEFGRDDAEGISGPEFVGTAVLVSTLASIGTLTLLIALLQSGVIL